MLSNEIERAKCVGLSTDGARALVGRLTGVVKRIKDIAPAAYSCSLQHSPRGTGHQDYVRKLKRLLDEAVKTVNFIKSYPLQSRLFGMLCTEMGSEQ